MTTNVLATLTALIGGIAVLYAALAAFGVELSQTQSEAVTGVLGLVLVVAGIWLHPKVPVGETGAVSPPK